MEIHIINYFKTRNAYVVYRKSIYSKKFFEAHGDEIFLFNVAKEGLSNLADDNIPKVKGLLDCFQKRQPTASTKAKKDMWDYQIAKLGVRGRTEKEAAEAKIILVGQLSCN